MRSLLLLFATCLVLCAEPPMSKLSVHVLTPSGKPLDRASVIVKFVSGHDKLKLYLKHRTQWETKTDQEGFTHIPAIPQGKIRVQVIASGYQTFGQEFDVDKDEQIIDIKLNPPQAQYSAH
ncbi:MAG: hypothetical protein JWO80_2825 [Bryobacterales bacterium]|nr:hypothetical protein [Bryobacterales bacterium]